MLLLPCACDRHERESFVSRNVVITHDVSIDVLRVPSVRTVEVRDAFDADRGAPLALYQSQCAAGTAAGCAELATAYKNGRGVTADGARAVQLYQRACDLGQASSCRAV